MQVRYATYSISSMQLFMVFKELLDQHLTWSTTTPRGQPSEQYYLDRGLKQLRPLFTHHKPSHVYCHGNPLPTGKPRKERLEASGECWKAAWQERRECSNSKRKDQSKKRGPAELWNKVTTTNKRHCIHLLGLPNKVHQTEWLEQQKRSVSQFWRLNAQGRGVTRVGPFWGSEGASAPDLSPSSSWFADNLSCSLACRRVTPSPPSALHGVLPVRVCLTVSPFNENISHVGLRWSLITSF